MDFEKEFTLFSYKTKPCSNTWLNGEIKNSFIKTANTGSQGGTSAGSSSAAPAAPAPGGPDQLLVVLLLLVVPKG